MSELERQCRSLFSAAVFAAICLAGCVRATRQDAASAPTGTLPATPDALYETADTLTDARDGQKYRKLFIDGKTWTARNLNYQTDSSWCYEDSPDSCAKYGRLYGWDAAKKACPPGWHLPSRLEWGYLAVAAGGVGMYGANDSAGTTLKSRGGWANEYCDEDGVCVDGIRGTDNLEFSALPGGYRRSVGSFSGAGIVGVWWTSTEKGARNAYLRSMDYGHEKTREDDDGKDYGRSVRCVRDN